MRFQVLGFAAAALLGVAAIGAGSAAAKEPGHVVVVKMVKQGGSDYRFEPATVTVQPGDVLQFEQDSDAPHNVQFDSWAKGAKLGSAQMGPYLTSQGQTYKLVIDSRFPAGKYTYECTPHGAMGMKGTITVAAAAQ